MWDWEPGICDQQQAADIAHRVVAQGQGSRYYIAIYRPKFAWITPNQLVNNPLEGLSHVSTDLSHNCVAPAAGDIVHIYMKSSSTWGYLSV